MKPIEFTLDRPEARIVLALAREQQRIQAEAQELQEALGKYAAHCMAERNWSDDKAQAQFRIDDERVTLIVIPVPPPEEAEPEEADA